MTSHLPLSSSWTLVAAREHFVTAAAVAFGGVGVAKAFVTVIADDVTATATANGTVNRATVAPETVQALRMMAVEAGVVHEKTDGN